MDYPCDLIRVANGMRGRDEETGEFLGASRSQQRRDALDVLELAQRLVALPPAQLAKLPVPEDLHPHIADTRRITSPIARKRQMAFLAKQMRRADDGALDAIRDAPSTEERRVGQECDSTCHSRWSPYHQKKKT